MKNPKKKNHVEAALDEGLEESFPASDPVAISFLKPVDRASKKNRFALTHICEKKSLSKRGARKDRFDTAFPRVERNEKRREIELKFEVESKHASQLINKMPLEGYLIGQARKKEITSTYFDTPDFWLKLHGLSLRLRHSNEGWVQTLKTSDMPHAGLYRRGEWECPVKEPTFDFIALRKMVGPHKNLKKLLRNELTLNAIFTTKVTRTTWNLELPTGDKVEFSLDQGSIKCNGLTEAICEIELELKSGESERLFACALQLIDAIPMQIGNLSKSARGYALYAPPHPIEVCTSGALELQNLMTVEEGCKAIIADCVRQIEENRGVLIQGANQEGLHQMRVGLRRLQAALTLFENFSPLPVGSKEEIDWLAEKLGTARDWNVFSNSTLATVKAPTTENDCLEHLRQAANEVATAKLDQAISAVRSVRYTRLVLTLMRRLACASWSDLVERKWKHHLSVPLPRFAAGCVLREQHRLHRCHESAQRSTKLPPQI